MVVFSVDDQQPVAKNDVAGDRDAFGPHCRGAHGFKRGHPNAILINLELNCHTPVDPGFDWAGPMFLISARILAASGAVSNAPDVKT